MPCAGLLATPCTTLQTQWLAGRLLGLNNLSYGDGRVTLLRIDRVAAASTNDLQVVALADTTVDRITQKQEDPWVEIELCRDHTSQGDLTFVWGEGAMGNEGFVAATRATELVWALFSTESNPFKRVEVVANYLKAYSDCQVYTINLEKLTDIRIQSYREVPVAGRLD